MPRVWAAVALLAGIAAGAMQPSAAADQPLRVVLAAAPHPDEDLIGRIRGQVSDLAVDLIGSPGDAPSGDLDQQLLIAAELGRRHRADAILWTQIVTTPGSGTADSRTVLFFVAQPGLRKVVVRSLECAPPAGTETSPAALTSACRETVALAARSALVALGHGDLGTSGPRAADWVLSAGWFMTGDGHSHPVQQGGLVRLGQQRERLGFAVSVSSGLPAGLRDDLTSIEIRQHRITAGVSWDLGNERILAISVAGRVGLALFHRATTAVAVADAGPAPEHYAVSPLMGPEIIARCRPDFLRGLGLAAGLALDVVPGAPDLVYTGAYAAHPGRQLWFVQPTASVALFVTGR